MALFPFGKTLYEKRAGDLVVQVIQKAGKRELRFGNHIVQSAIAEKTPDLLQLRYTQAMMVGLLLLPPPARVLHLGLGAGALARVIHRHFPDTRQTVAEISPEVIEVAYRFFDLPRSPRLEVVNQEGARFLKENPATYGLIFLDAYHADGVADHLQTVPFFRSVAARLAAGGWVVNNVWGSDRANLELVKRNLGKVFPHLFSVSVGAESNIILFAAPETTAPPSAAELAQRSDRLAPALKVDFSLLTRRLARVGPDRANPFAETAPPERPGPFSEKTSP